ncbi:MAG: CHAT domain-containing protein [Planctomycetes bacterium]|nr:CHAT domain-containing protein [Planctomycetota bacterium]
MLQLEAGRRLREGNLELARLALDRAWLAMPEHFDVRVRQQVVQAEVELAAGRPAEALAAIAASREILRRAVESESLWARGGVGTFQALYSEALGVAFRVFQALAAANASAAAEALPTLYDIVQTFHGYEAACLFRVARLPLQVEDLAGSVRSSASAMVARREHLQRTIERLQRARVTPGRMAVDLRAELRRLQAEREAVDGNLALLLAQAGGMVAAPPQATLAEVQRALQPKELLVEFVRTEGRFAAFCIDVAGAELAWLTASPTVEAGLAAFAQARGSGDAAGCDAALADLGDLLPEQGPLGRRLRDAEVVLVSPEGSLGGLPFAALPWGPRGLLGEQVTLGYVASGTVLADLRRRPLRSHGELSQGRLLALANPRYGGNPGHREVVRGGADLSRIGSLPWSAREAVEVARGFASSESETAALAGITDPTRVDATLMGARFRVLLGSHARESALDAGALSGVDFLHLACHGFADPEAAALSFLALTLDDGAPDEGLLRIDEFPKLRGDRELVALSACDTGSGPTVGHEGPASLARAVQAVGARRVLATSWRVDDDEAHRVVTRFYALWLRDGRAAAEALAVAQREARAAGSPTRDWASFSLWGEPR